MNKLLALLLVLPINACVVNIDERTVYNIETEDIVASIPASDVVIPKQGEVAIASDAVIASGPKTTTEVKVIEKIVKVPETKIVYKDKIVEKVVYKEVKGDGCAKMVMPVLKPLPPLPRDEIAKMKIGDIPTLDRITLNYIREIRMAEAYNRKVMQEAVARQNKTCTK